MPSDTAYHGDLGDHFVQLSAVHPTNAHIDRPAMLALIGDVAGQDVLDVGCGGGFYCAAMVERGARVTGIDGSETLLAHAAEATGGRAALVRHDLEQPLPFADASFDLAVMALVYHHVYDRPQLLGELRRVLRPGARLLVSGTHAAGEHRWLGGSYYEGGRVDAPVGDGRTINFERMTIERFVNELLDGGFVLERLLEPQPTEAFREADPVEYERIGHRPNVLTLALRRPAG